MLKPEVSVVIATYNRDDTLKDTLQSLLGQTYPKDLFEVVVVDDNSTDDTSSVVESLTPYFSGRLKFIRKEVNEGPGKARNAGIEASDAEIIAFTDSDCIADKDWLKNGLAKFADGVAIVQGKTLPNPGQSIDIFSRTIEVASESGMYETCNIFYRREAIEEVGGFSMHYRRARDSLGNLVSGVDIDLAWRVKRKGWKSIFAEDALVYHHVFRRRVWQTLIEPYRLFIIPYLIKRFPEIRPGVSFLRIFHTKITFLFDLFLLSVLFGILAHPGFFLFGAPYMANHLKSIFYRRQVFKYGQGVLLFILYVIQDFIGFCALAYSSIRYRSVLV